ncbi:chromosomal replication initiator protein DnaA [Natronogracilivirga saccharolytica]|uniref:Chromosomal replication initiator protein DnaA n=1 Tax=Natronogracilivirga saccharolytica TaxID=2812953 RepID=A0A8J7S869_9BACT|nr:chromosomal replication initiator protein DnaA [Natronogracilivirga saccharolytica]MBP3191996.1 chromosomal replication initiator protein DnaA [Natronogracilivirga saccharolytica]
MLETDYKTGQKSELAKANNEELTAGEVWGRCLEIIRDNINHQKYKSWFQPIKPVALDGKTLTIQVPSQFWYEWLEEHYYNIMRSTIARILGEGARFEYSIVLEKAEQDNDDLAVRMPQRSSPPAQESEGQTGNPAYGFDSSYSTEAIQNPFVIPGIRKHKIDPNLNENYVFSQFIEGDCNRLARSAAIAIAENPGKNSFNPFFVYGGVGLGKTHLIQSIGNKIRQDFGDEFSVLYISSDQFTNEFVHAIRNNRAREFSMFYRNIDVLIIDDIQFFSGKEKTQEEFFHIFNALHQDGKQIIMTSDRAPKDIQDIEERLISRFNWGLSTDLQMPDYETRYAILEKKSLENGIEFEGEIFEFIAHNFKSSVRDLQGAIIKLLATASLQKIDNIDLTMAKRILKDLIKETKKHISIEDIQKMVCDYFGIDPNKVREKTRKQEIVEARQIAMYLSKTMTKSSLKTIGLQFGGRDHSTVIHAINAVEDRQETSPKFRQVVKDIRQRVELAIM